MTGSGVSTRVTGRHGDTCDRTRALISRSLDCELPQLQQSLVRAHVRRCEACAAFEVDVRWITSSLRQSPLEESPSVVVPRRRRQPIRLRVAVQAASITLVAGGVGSVVLAGGPVVAHTGEEGLLAAPLTDTVVANARILVRK